MTKPGSFRGPSCRADDLVAITLVGIGPSGIGGEYQEEKVQ